MPLTPRTRPIAFIASAAARSGRRSAPSCRSGASSLIRLAQPSGSRLPSSDAIGGWVERAARVLAVHA